MEKSMPRSCGLALRALRFRERLTDKELIRKLFPHTKRFRGDEEFSEDIISKAEHSQQTLYWLLDGYAKWSGYPVGFIYLFAQFSAELRDKNVQGARAIVAAMRVLADLIDQEADRLVNLQPDAGTSQTDPLDKIANNTVRGYEKMVSRDDEENECDDGPQVKYKGSDQMSNDARQVRIVLELLARVPSPCPPSQNLAEPAD